MFSFNLIEERWLPCLMSDSSFQEMSLRDVFLNANNIRELIGDSPPVTIALHRLLLAILHRALNAPQSYDEWNIYWQAKTWDTVKLENYLEKWKHRFDLFDERFPFYQVASVKDDLQEGAIIQLYFQGKNNATLFEHSTTSTPKSVSSAEAARLLIAFQGFDFGGIKADGSAQTAPLLQRAISLIRGENLFETMLLNLHHYNQEDGEPFDFKAEKDLPAWERDTETEAKERKLYGYVDFLTWQSRRILLKPQTTEDSKVCVKDTVIMRGFQFPKDFEAYNKETMVAFKKSKKEGFYPIGFNENKALWRNSLSLFQTIEGENYRPKILNWINNLAYEGYLERSKVFPIEFYGLAADKGKLLFWQQEKFNLPIAYLNDNDLLAYLKTVIQFAEDIADVLKITLKKLAESLETKPDSFSAMPIYWSSLEFEFQKLLLNLPTNKDMAMREWFGFVSSTAKEVFSKTADSLSGSAMEQKAIVNAQGLFNRTRSKLLKENSIYQEFLPNYKTKGDVA